MSDHDWGSTDISDWSVLESCLWLLFLLDVDKRQNRAYSLPFARYVLTWCEAVPLTAIIIGQNPYPNDIFPEIAAAMSYDSTLCQRCDNISGSVPPTVKVLANDLWVNAALPREDTISTIKDGWALAERGVLLVNNSVFHDWRSVEGYKECVNQTTIILRLLQETEKHGPRTVQLFVLGDAAQRMASNICSWYKSSTVRISKKSVTHPAALSRRFDDLYDPACHLGEKKFSASLAELLRNHVAFVHTMSRRGKDNSALVRQADSFKHLADNLPKHRQATDAVAVLAREVANMDPSNWEPTKAALLKLADSMEALSSRSALLSSVVSTAHSAAQSAAGIVSKSAPHEATIAPQTIPEIPPSRLVATPVTFRSRRPARSEAGDSTLTFASSDIPTPATPANASRSQTPTGSAVHFRSRVASSTSVRSESLSSAPVPISFRSRNNINSENTVRAQSENVHAPVPSKSSDNSGSASSPLKMSTAQIQQLSCIESTIELLASDIIDNSETGELLELIQHDIKNKIKYNTVTQELCDAIDADLERNSKFDLAAEALSGNDSSTASATLAKCKELFEF